MLSAMYRIHPYEEVAFDLFSIDEPTQTWGIGRIGELPEALDLDTFVSKVKEVFQLEGLRVVRPTHTNSTVKRIAICGGSGEKFYLYALAQKADVYITGDIYYHTAQDMQSAGLIAIDQVIILNLYVKKSLSKNLRNGNKKKIGPLISLFQKRIRTHFNLTKGELLYVRKSFTTFLRYVKTETRSDESSQTTPSTQTQVAFAQVLKKELEDLGLTNVFYNEENGCYRNIAK